MSLFCTIISTPGGAAETPSAYDYASGTPYSDTPSNAAATPSDAYAGYGRERDLSREMYIYIYVGIERDLYIYVYLYIYVKINRHR